MKRLISPLMLSSIAQKHCKQQSCWMEDSRQEFMWHSVGWQPVNQVSCQMQQVMSEEGEPLMEVCASLITGSMEPLIVLMAFEFSFVQFTTMNSMSMQPLIVLMAFEFMFVQSTTMNSMSMVAALAMHHPLRDALTCMVKPLYSRKHVFMEVRIHGSTSKLWMCPLVYPDFWRGTGQHSCWATMDATPCHAIPMVLSCIRLAYRAIWALMEIYPLFLIPRPLPQPTWQMPQSRMSTEGLIGRRGSGEASEWRRGGVRLARTSYGLQHHLL